MRFPFHLQPNSVIFDGFQGRLLLWLSFFLCVLMHSCTCMLVLRVWRSKGKSLISAPSLIWLERSLVHLACSRLPGQASQNSPIYLPSCQRSSWIIDIHGAKLSVTSEDPNSAPHTCVGALYLPIVPFPSLTLFSREAMRCCVDTIVSIPVLNLWAETACPRDWLVLSHSQPCPVSLGSQECTDLFSVATLDFVFLIRKLACCLFLCNWRPFFFFAPCLTLCIIFQYNI